MKARLVIAEGRRELPAPSKRGDQRRAVTAVFEQYTALVQHRDRSPGWSLYTPQEERQRDRRGWIADSTDNALSSMDVE